MHCSVIEHGYDVIEFSNCNTEERSVSRVLLCSLKTKWRHGPCSITEQCTPPYVLTALGHSHVLYFPNMENAVHCSLIMHGFHNGKWLILCSKNYETLQIRKEKIAQNAVFLRWHSFVEPVALKEIKILLSPPYFCRNSLKLLSPTLPILMNWILLSPHPCPPTLTPPKFGNVHLSLNFKNFYI